MNFLAHLLVADHTSSSAAGAILGDIVRGSDLSAYPDDIRLGIRIHRRVDVLTDHHPLLQQRRQTFAPAARRYAGIVLDLAGDYALAQDWSHCCDEPLAAFCSRQAERVAAAKEWFEYAGGHPPQASSFAKLLMSYASVDGIDRAVQRTASRLREPAPLIDAANGWSAHTLALRTEMPQVLADVVAGVRELISAQQTAAG